MSWSDIVSVANIVSLGFVGFALVFTALQLREMRKATWAQVFIAASERLQDEDVRAARRTAFELRDQGKPWTAWDDGEVRAVEMACHNYDVVGQRVTSGMLPKDFIIGSWGDSLRRLWPVVEPWLRHLRARQGFPALWRDFEYLANEATHRWGPPPAGS